MRQFALLWPSTFLKKKKNYDKSFLKFCFFFCLQSFILCHHFFLLNQRIIIITARWVSKTKNGSKGTLKLWSKVIGSILSLIQSCVCVGFLWVFWFSPIYLSSAWSAAWWVQGMQGVSFGRLCVSSLKSTVPTHSHTHAHIYSHINSHLGTIKHSQSTCF